MQAIDKIKTTIATATSAAAAALNQPLHQPHPLRTQPHRCLLAPAKHNAFQGTVSQNVSQTLQCARRMQNKHQQLHVPPLTHIQRPPQLAHAVGQGEQGGREGDDDDAGAAKDSSGFNVGGYL